VYLRGKKQKDNPMTIAFNFSVKKSNDKSAVYMKMAPAKVPYQACQEITDRTLQISNLGSGQRACGSSAVYPGD
jgi:hypothetical protein